MRLSEQIERLAYMFKIKVLGQKFEYLIPVLQADTPDGKTHYERYFFAQKLCKAKRVFRAAMKKCTISTRGNNAFDRFA